MDQAMTITQASANGHTNTEPPLLEWEEPNDFWSISEHGNAGIGAEATAGYRELRGHERVRQGPGRTLHGVPCSDFIWSKLMRACQRDLHLTSPNNHCRGAPRRWRARLTGQAHLRHARP